MSINLLNRQEYVIQFARHTLLLCGSAALYWPQKKTLVVADLHLEKGSYFAARGNPLPLYDSIITLKKIQEIVELYQPDRVISLGDNIHDPGAFGRMIPESFVILKSILQGIKEWIWIGGNHDKATLPPLFKGIVCVEDYMIENISFSHELLQNREWQIIGHFHPKARCKTISGKCFVYHQRILYMPAFGTYVGGLDINSSVFKQLFNRETYSAYMVYREKIWRLV